MKKFFSTLIIGIICISAIAQADLLNEADFADDSKTVIVNPPVAKTTATYVHLRSVELNDTATILEFDVRMKPGSWMSIPQETYIKTKDSKRKLFVVNAIGIPIGEMYSMPGSGMTNYKLVFPPIDPRVLSIDYGESNSSGRWYLTDIVLSNGEAEIPFNTAGYVKVVERPLFSSSTASNVYIERVALAETSTVLFFTVYASPGSWISIPQESFIKPEKQNKKLFVKETIDIPLIEKVKIPSDGKISYQLVFDAIDPETKRFDFGESNKGGTWQIYGIKLTDDPDPVEADTTSIRFGKHGLDIIEDDKNIEFDWDFDKEFKSKWKDEPDGPKTIIKKKKRRKDFDGHWDGIDFGGNQLWETTYPTSIYPAGTSDFLATRPEKSFEFNINFSEYSFGFCPYVGLVTGLGLNFNDYKFNNRITIVKDENGIIQAQDLPEGDFRKSKLSTTFLHAPLLLEFQIPGQWDKKRMFIAGGVIGGVKLGEHTKYKIGKNKTKDKGQFNIAPLRWGYTARIGFDDVGIFATYYNTKLFEEGMGPTTTPITIGFSFNLD